MTRALAALAITASMTIPSAAATPSLIHFSTTLTIGGAGGAPLALSRERKLLATTGDGRVRVFALGPPNVVPLHELAVLPIPKWFSQLAFSPDGSSLIGAGDGATVWSTQDWKARWSLPAGESENAIAYSPDGKTLYLAGSTTSLAAFDASDGTVRWKQASLATGTSRIAVAPDGKSAAVGSYGGGLRLVSTVDGATIAPLADTKTYGGKATAAQRAGWLAHPGAVEAIAFSPDGALLASAGGDGTIKVWDVAKRVVRWASVCGITTATLAFDADGHTLDAGCGRTIQRLDVRSGKIAATLRGHGGDVADIVADPDNNSLWSAAADGTLKRWDLSKRDTAATYGAIDAAALSADGRTLAYARGDDAIVLRDVASDRTVATLRGHDVPPVTEDHSYAREAVALSRDGTYVAAGGYVTSGFIDHSGVAKAVTRLWRRSNAQPLRTWNGVAPDAMAFSPNAAQLVVRSPAMSDTPDTVWRANLASGALTTWVAQWKLYVDKDSYWPCSPDGFDSAGIAFTKTGPALVVASGDCTKQQSQNAPLRLWPIGVRMPGPPFGGPAVITYGALALSADGTMAVTLDANRFAVWDVARRSLRSFGSGLPPSDYSPRLESLAIGGEYAVALMLADPSRKGNWNRYRLTVRRLRDLTVSTTQERPGSERSRLLVSSDGTRAYVTTPAGVDVWILKSLHS